MKRMFSTTICAALLAAGSFAHAEIPLPAEKGIKDAIAALSPSYDDVRPNGSCKAPAGTDQIVCANKTLALMDELSAKAYVYAIENATKSEVDHSRTRDVKWIRGTRNKCKTEACLISALIKHTNDSLGGESPYR